MEAQSKANRIANRDEPRPVNCRYGVGTTVGTIEGVPHATGSHLNDAKETTYWDLSFFFVARRSIQLSYGRADTLFTFNSLAQFLARFQPRVSPHSHPINSKRLSKNYLYVRASSF